MHTKKLKDGSFRTVFNRDDVRRALINHARGHLLSEMEGRVTPEAVLDAVVRYDGRVMQSYDRATITLTPASA